MGLARQPRAAAVTAGLLTAGAGLSASEDGEAATAAGLAGADELESAAGVLSAPEQETRRTAAATSAPANSNVRGVKQLTRPCRRPLSRVGAYIEAPEIGLLPCEGSSDLPGSQPQAQPR